MMGEVSRGIRMATPVRFGNTKAATGSFRQGPSPSRFADNFRLGKAAGFRKNAPKASSGKGGKGGGS